MTQDNSWLKGLLVGIWVICVVVFTIGNGHIVNANGGKQDDSEEAIIPIGLPVITPENAHLLEPVTKLGRGTAQNLRWSSDGEHLIVTCFSAVWIYDADDFSQPRQHLDLSGKTLRAIDADLSPDDNWVVVREPLKVQLWDLNGESEPVVLAESRDAAAGFHPDGRVAYSTPAFTVELRDIDTGESVAFEGHTDLIRSLAFSPDGLLMATASDDGTARLWNTQTQDEIQQFTLDGEALVGVRFSPDGNQLAISAGHAINASYNPLDPPQDYPIALFDLISNARVATFYTTTDSVTSPVDLSFSPDGRFLAENSFIYDIERQIAVENANLVGGRNFHFSPNGEWIAMLTPSGPQILETENFTVHTALPYYGAIWYVDFNREANIMMWQVGSITQLVHLETGRVITDIDGAVGQMFVESGELLMITEDNQIAWWDVQSGSVVNQIEAFPDVAFIDISEDSSRLLASTWAGHIKVWDVETKTPIFDLVTDPPLYGFIRFDRDEQLIIADSYFRILVWEIETGALLVNLENIQASAVSPDGELLAYQLKDSQTVQLADSRTGETIAEFPIITGAGAGIQFNNAGTLMTVASSNFVGGDGAVHVIDIETRQEIAGYEFRGLPWGAIFSPDDRFMTLVGDREEPIASIVQLWNVETGQEIATIEGITGGSLVRYNADQTLLITGAGTSPGHVIATQTGTKLIVLSGQGSGATNYWFSPDETFIATASADGTVWIWGVSD